MTKEQLKRIEEKQAEFEKMGYKIDIKSAVEEKMQTYDLSFDDAFYKLFYGSSGVVRPIRRENVE
jgi:hypothetical protein